MPDKNFSDDSPKKNLKFTYLLTVIMIIIIAGGYVYKAEIRSVIDLLSFLKQPVETTIPAAGKPSDTGTTSSAPDVFSGSSKDTKAAQKVSNQKKKKEDLRQKRKRPEAGIEANDFIKSDGLTEQTNMISEPLAQNKAEAILPAVEETGKLITEASDKPVEEYVRRLLRPSGLRTI
jgi:hypothetical protein